MRGRKHLAVIVGVAGSMVAFAACGEEDFANEPRRAAPIEVTAKVDLEKVKVSPSEIGGAGLVNVTISNQSEDQVVLTFDGPVTKSSEPIEAGSVGSVEIDFKQGEYEVDAGPESAAKTQTISVGPPRDSAQNTLLLP